MAFFNPRYTAHPFLNHKRWTGKCAVPGCGLPTEHPLHQYILPVEDEGEKFLTLTSPEPKPEPLREIPRVDDPRQSSLF